MMCVVTGLPGEEGGEDELRGVDEWAGAERRGTHGVEEVAEGVVEVAVVEQCLVAELWRAARGVSRSRSGGVRATTYFVSWRVLVSVRVAILANGEERTDAEEARE